MSNNLNNSEKCSNLETPTTPINFNNAVNFSSYNSMPVTPERPIIGSSSERNSQELKEQRQQLKLDRPILAQDKLDRLKTKFSESQRSIIMTTRNISGGCKATNQRFNNNRDNPGSGGSAAITIKC